MELDKLKKLILTAMALLLSAPAVLNAEPELPLLTDPPTNKVLAGKFVWADLVTDDVERVKTFYTSLFNLGWQEIRPAPDTYGLLTMDGRAVAGIAYHEAPEEKVAYGRWIHYMSVDDVARAEKLVQDSGGRTVLSRRSFDQRGEFAIVMGPDQALVGLMRSSSGDPEDYRSDYGEWLWRELYSADPSASAELYQGICQCEVFPREDIEGDYIIASQDYLRASISSLADTREGSASWLGYVQVASISAALKRVTELGGRIEFAPSEDVLDGRLAVIQDPSGAYLGLVAWAYDDSTMEASQ
jgi:predicted enzyme related to lactoylglutathione lyase